MRNRNNNLRVHMTKLVIKPRTSIAISESSCKLKVACERLIMVTTFIPLLRKTFTLG